MVSPSLPQMCKHTVELPYPGTGDGEVAAFQGPNNRQKLLLAERRSAAECGLATRIDQLGHPAYVVIVPVGGDHQTDDLGGVKADALQVSQGPSALHPNQCKNRQ